MPARGFGARERGPPKGRPPRAGRAERGVLGERVAVVVLKRMVEERGVDEGGDQQERGDGGVSHGVSAERGRRASSRHRADMGISTHTRMVPRIDGARKVVCWRRNPERSCATNA